MLWRGPILQMPNRSELIYHHIQAKLEHQPGSDSVALILEARAEFDGRPRLSLFPLGVGSKLEMATDTRESIINSN